MNRVRILRLISSIITSFTINNYRLAVRYSLYDDMRTALQSTTMSGAASGNGADDKKRFRARHNTVGKRHVRGFMRQILLASEKAQVSPALPCMMVADGAAQHRIARFDRIEKRSL